MTVVAKFFLRVPSSAEGQSNSTRQDDKPAKAKACMRRCVHAAVSSSLFFAEQVRRLPLSGSLWWAGGNPKTPPAEQSDGDAAIELLNLKSLLFTVIILCCMSMLV